MRCSCRRRAILLVLSRHPKDSSEHTAATVSHYLAAIRVPLVVWSFASPILWIEGNHFPGTIRPAPAAEEVVDLVR